MRYIQLSENIKTKVNNQDYSFLSKYKWSVSKNAPRKYAYRNKVFGDKRKRIYMHRLVADRKGLPINGVRVDHADNDSLNNTRKNLRLATHSQNIANSKIHSNNTSGYRGVSFDKRRKKWVVQIKLFSRRMVLGNYSSKIKAAKIYDYANLKFHGRFARLNFNQKPPKEIKYIDTLIKIYMDNQRVPTRNMRQSSNKSGYIGVSWHKRMQRWVAQISIHNQKIHIGYFKNKIDAARAYDEMAFNNLGALANLNFHRKVF